MEGCERRGVPFIFFLQLSKPWNAHRNRPARPTPFTRSLVCTTRPLVGELLNVSLQQILRSQPLVNTESPRVEQCERLQFWRISQMCFCDPVWAECMWLCERVPLALTQTARMCQLDASSRTVVIYSLVFALEWIASRVSMLERFVIVVPHVGRLSTSGHSSVAWLRSPARWRRKGMLSRRTSRSN